jgi:EPS-associated MarR family transcriptional regulator
LYDGVDRTAGHRVQCSSSYRTLLCYSPRPRLLNVIRHAVACPEHIQTHTVKKKLVNFMTSRQAKLQEDTYFRVMRILQENPDLTQRELAEKLGISVGGLNYCLKALMGKGLVKMKNFANSKNKFGYVYVLTPTGMAEKAAITHRFLRRKLDEYEALKAEIEALKTEVGDNEINFPSKASS